MAKSVSKKGFDSPFLITVTGLIPVNNLLLINMDT